MAESRIVIYVAISSNLAIAATKFIVAAFTGSAAMVSEGVHSLVDTGNGVLLLIGSRLSERPATEEHPFGHGKELYFWGLIVAILIFGLGGGASVYEGFLHIRDPQPLTAPWWTYATLGVSALFEGTSLIVAFRKFKAQSGSTPLWRALHQSKDPTTYTVLAEDSVALVGLGVAALGIYLSQRFQAPAFDGAASVLIGLLLAGVAVLLIRESRGLLIGEGLQLRTAQAIRRVALGHAEVRAVGAIRSMYIGPAQVLVTLSIEFDDRTDVPTLEATIESIGQEVRRQFPMIAKIYIEPRAKVGDPADGAPRHSTH
ncbi:MAG: cation diffusion facilitator family transporter [Burkholderiales bacterium]